MASAPKILPCTWLSRGAMLGTIFMKIVIALLILLIPAIGNSQDFINKWDPESICLLKDWYAKNNVQEAKFVRYDYLENGIDTNVVWELKYDSIEQIITKIHWSDIKNKSLKKKYNEIYKIDSLGVGWLVSSKTDSIQVVIKRDSLNRIIQYGNSKITYLNGCQVLYTDTSVYRTSMNRPWFEKRIDKKEGLSISYSSYNFQTLIEQRIITRVRYFNDWNAVYRYSQKRFQDETESSGKIKVNGTVISVFELDNEGKPRLNLQLLKTVPNNSYKANASDGVNLKGNATNKRKK
jgi:hypothetical protein